MLTVSQLTWQLKELVEPQFTRVHVRGEISGFRGANARGHLYFAIKDANATLDVRIWQSMAKQLKFALKDGLSVVIEGSINVYEPQGRYALIAQRIDPVGVGAQALAFEQLKQKLVAEGLIGEKRRRPPRPLPFLPKRIGVVTSISGAALRDFLKVLHRRHPRLAVLVADARVQGDGAMYEVRRAIRALWNTDVDVIVVTRGGGSADDLWTFNEEHVVRAIAESPVPVVSAVGHEIDTTLSDLVADLRAPTPSAAAEALAPVLAELELALASYRAQLVRGVEKAVLHRKNELKALMGSLGDPRRRLTEQKLRLSESAERMARVLRRQVRTGNAEVRVLAERLQRARPQAQLRARREAFDALHERLLAAAQRRMRDERQTLSRLELELERSSPKPALGRAKQTLEHDARRLAQLLRQRLLRERERLGAAGAKLDALSPLKVLGRGYAIAQRDDGRVVRRAADVAVGQQLRLRLGGDDELSATVTQVKHGAK